MRAGIVGKIYGYTEHGRESHGQGIQDDALEISREFKAQTVVHLPLRNGIGFPVTWYEAGDEIEEPDWARGDDD